MNKQFKEQILKMDENEWTNFRIQKWKQTKRYFIEHTLPPPDFFLSSKKSYIDFCESRTNKDKANALFSLTDKKSQELNLLFDTIEKQDTFFKSWSIEDMDDKQWQEYRKRKWQQQMNNQIPENGLPPTNFINKWQKRLLDS